MNGAWIIWVGILVLSAGVIAIALENPLAAAVMLIIFWLMYLIVRR